VKSKAITAETSDAILDEAWRMASEERTLDLSMSELARRSGVSRQTVYLAFENRAGLLLAMVDRIDAKSDERARLAAAGQAATGTPDTLFAYAQAWIAYMPVVYPVASLLSAAGLTDVAAAKAWASRMVMVRGGFKHILSHIEAAGRLAEGWTAEHAADLCFELTHVESWRILVVERGWTSAEFSDSRIKLMSLILR